MSHLWKFLGRTFKVNRHNQGHSQMNNCKKECDVNKILTAGKWWASKKPPLAVRNYSVCPLSGNTIIIIIAGQSYEIRMLDNRKIGELPEITGKMVKVSCKLTFCVWILLSFETNPGHVCCCVWVLPCIYCKRKTCSVFQSIIRVVFHDRRLQYTEHQQLEGWRWNRPGDRILDLGKQ